MGAKRARACRHGVLGLAVAGVWAVVALPAGAELQHVEQKVYGMDCAPCAYGTERRMQRLEGVTEVALSLDEGTVVLGIEPGSALTLHAIRDQIVRGGFSPRAARIEVAGELQGDDGELRLVTGTGEDYRLTRDAEAAWERLQAMEVGDRLVVAGEVPAADPGDGPRTLELRVGEVRRLAG